METIRNCGMSPKIIGGVIDIDQFSELTIILHSKLTQATKESLEELFISADVFFI